MEWFAELFLGLLELITDVFFIGFSGMGPNSTGSESENRSGWFSTVICVIFWGIVVGLLVWLIYHFCTT
jgi:hypothetical protein